MTIEARHRLAVSEADRLAADHAPSGRSVIGPALALMMFGSGIAVAAQQPAAPAWTPTVEAVVEAADEDLGRH